LSFDYDARMYIEGIADLHDEMKVTDSRIDLKPRDFYCYLGHTQAPTSSVRDFQPETSHPFVCGTWVIAHNGVLTNDKALKKTLKKGIMYNEVDSSVIPALLSQETDTNQDEVSALCNVLSKLEGTFGLWIYNKLSNNVYLARSGSTIYADFLTNSFSSLPYKKFKSLDEGVLYLMTKEGLTSVGGFQNNSPFFVL
jgi:glucosamine 6-phosphate synthetase-like amidotransferase/phosphosugar isomerase protein